MKKCGKCHQHGHNRRTCGMKRLPSTVNIANIDVSAKINTKASYMGTAGGGGGQLPTDYNAIIDSLTVEVFREEKAKSGTVAGDGIETANASNSETDQGTWSADELNTLWLLQGKDEKMTSKGDPKWSRWYTSNGERRPTIKSEKAVDELFGFLRTYKDRNITTSDWKMFLSQFQPEIREQLAQRSGLTNPIYVALAQDKSSLVRRKALANKNLDSRIASTIVDNMSSGRRTVGALASIEYIMRKREDFPAETLQKIHDYVLGEPGHTRTDHARTDHTQKDHAVEDTANRKWVLVPNNWLARTKFRNKDTHRVKSREVRLKKLITTQILVSEKTSTGLFKNIIEQGPPLEFISTTFSVLKSERVENSNEKFNFLASWVKKKNSRREKSWSA